MTAFVDVHYMGSDMMIDFTHSKVLIERSTYGNKYNVSIKGILVVTCQLKKQVTALY